MFESLEYQSLVLLGIGLLAVSLFFLIAISKMRRWLKANWARRQHELDLDEMRERWVRVERLAASGVHEGGRLAVIEADKLLDFVLKEMHIPGETFALRMRFAQKKYFELKRTRFAHELRNKIVHDPYFNLRRGQLHSALKEFRKALRILGAL